MIGSEPVYYYIEWLTANGFHSYLTTLLLFGDWTLILPEALHSMSEFHKHRLGLGTVGVWFWIEIIHTKMCLNPRLSSICACEVGSICFMQVFPSYSSLALVKHPAGTKCPCSISGVFYKWDNIGSKILRTFLRSVGKLYVKNLFGQLHHHYPLLSIMVLISLQKMTLNPQLVF